MVRFAAQALGVEEDRRLERDRVGGQWTVAEIPVRNDEGTWHKAAQQGRDGRE